MKILIATGIYPPDIGGIATYAVGLAKEFTKIGHEVWVVAYGGDQGGQERQKRQESGVVINVPKHGGVIVRWLRYARALRRHGHDVDVVIALSSVSVGIPLFLSCLFGKKKVLRLGGDFFWERYTDSGGMLGLSDWYQTRFGFWRIMHGIFMEFILQRFHGIVYSTAFQKKLHDAKYLLPRNVVIENPAPVQQSSLALRTGQYPHQPFRLLSMGRFVGFKNLCALVSAIRLMPDVSCTFVGSGPLEPRLCAMVKTLGLTDRVTFRPPARGTEKGMVFAEHDLLVIPSTTDISPNTALEARVSGLPVLLTKHTGFSSRLAYGIILEEMMTPEQIADAVHGVRIQYEDIGRIARIPLLPHDWDAVAREWDTFLKSLV
jgi:glycosyltransferase involved in cell wall biosynthesis